MGRGSLRKGPWGGANVGGGEGHGSAHFQCNLPTHAMSLDSHFVGACLSYSLIEISALFLNCYY